jgi:two-component system cell cycle sensor histidine kinase/response regulator CckA
VVEADDGRSALAAVALRRPDLAVVEHVLPDTEGLCLLGEIRCQADAPELPAVVMSAMVSRLRELGAAGGFFTQILPKPLEPALLLDVVRAHLAPRASWGRGKTVLVLAGEPRTRELVTLRLKEAGYDVETASEGEEGLAKARRRPPDAIVSQVQMPAMDAYAFCGEARRDPGLAAVPIVLVYSGRVEEADRELARGMGANALVIGSATPQAGAAAEAGQRTAGPATEPESSDVVAAVHRECVYAQLDRRRIENLALLRQAGFQATALELMRSLSAVLAQPQDLPKVIGDILVECLDVAGLSTGLLYLAEPAEPGSRYRLQAHCGLLVAARADAEGCFGHPELVARIVAAGEPVALSSAASGADAGSREFLARLGHASALIVPLVVLGQSFGALVLASDTQILADSTWLGFAHNLAAQFGHTVALGQSLDRLAASEQRYRALMEQANDAILILDLGQRILEANREAQRLLGRVREEIVGRQYDDFVVSEAPGDPARRSEELPGDPACRPMELPSDGVPRVESRCFVRADGTRVPVEVSCSVVRLGEESRLLAIFRDVTERRRGEVALREAQHRLEQSEEQYRLLFDHNPQPMWVDEDSTLAFLAVNEAAVAHYGYSRRELMAMTTRDLYPPEEAAAYDEHVASRTWERGRKAFHSPRVWKHRRRNGELIDVEISLSPIEFGGRPAWLVIATDVSEKKRLEAQFLQAGKMESVGRLAGGVAHDFNNLLTAILGYSGLLAGRLTAAADLRDLDEIRKAGERAAALTRQLLAFSRNQVLRPKAVDLNAVVVDVEAMLRRLIGEEIELVTALRADSGQALVDPGQVEQVIVNLAVNARDAMPEGGKLILETAPIEIDATYAHEHRDAKLGPHVMIAVSDTGQGMDEETSSRIFEPFFTTKDHGKGTGLGLSTVYGIVHQSGGHIDVYSELGRGTTFKVYFPRVDRAEESPAAGPLAPRTRPRGSETVLVVEDEAALRPLIRAVLESGGYTVLDAATPEAALSLAGGLGGPIDLLLTDIVMPGLSGPDVASRLAAARPEVRVLFMSGYSGNVVGRQNLLPPGADFLGKPFTLQGLLEKVREVLDSAPA